MTSKRLFHNLIRQDLRNRLWLVSILSALELLLIPVIYLMQMDYYVEGEYWTAAEIAKSRMSTTEAFFGTEQWVPLIAVSAAVAAFTGFAWLCAQRKIDYYHAMPMKREHIFLAFFTSGWLMGTIPFAVSEMIAFYAVGGAYRQVTRSTAGLFWRSLLILVLLYLAVYAIAVLAMVMTGRIVIGVLLSVMIEVYAPVCLSLYGCLMGTFDTFWSENISLSTARFLSPLLVAWQAGEGRTAAPAAALLLYAAAAFLAGILVYRRRPSETAGAAYVHPRIASAVKGMVSVPCGLLFVCFFYLMSGTSGSRTAWAVVWALIGAVLADVVMELVQHLDPASILKGWRSALVIIGSTVAVMLLVVAKPFDYDQYLPAESRIAKMGIACDEINGILMPETSYSGYGQEQKEMVSRTMTSDFSELYALAEEGKKYAGILNSDSEDSTQYSSVVLAYRKKTGGLVYRSYQIPQDTLMDTLSALSKDAAFRRSVNPAYDMKASEFNRIDLQNWLNYQPYEEQTTIDLSPSEAQQFTDALRKDMDRAELGTLLEEKPVLAVTRSYYSAKDQGFETPEYSEVYVYPEYENTLAFLAKKGFVPEKAMTVGEIADTLNSLQVSYVSGEKDYSATITGRDDIVKLLSSIDHVRRDRADSDLTVVMTSRKGYVSYPEFRITDETAFRAVTGFAP
jgi:ABC-2 type transport system permease protein